MSRRVLIVEDDRSMCEMLQTRLTHRGFDVVWRLSAEEALDLLQTMEFDVVVTDYHMPGFDGGELASAIRATHRTMPIALVTGSLAAVPDPTIFDAVFEKPVASDHLAHALRRLVAR